MVKRRRLAVGYSTPRPIDKKLINVSQAPTTTQAETTLFTARGACTVAGLRWDLQAYGNGAEFCGWALVLIRDGQTTPSIVVSTGGASFYEPEQDVLAFGRWNGAISGSVVTRWTDSTKTMRKLKDGDKIVFLSRANASSTDEILGTFQLFCKE